MDYDNSADTIAAPPGVDLGARRNTTKTRNDKTKYRSYLKKPQKTVCNNIESCGF